MSDGEQHAADVSSGDQPQVTGSSPRFPVVGVGASAGGLEAFVELLQQLPPDTGMAFVLIQHLDPSHASYLGEALARSTRLPVHEAEDGMPIQPDHVYVIPSNADVGLLNGALALFPRPTEGRKRHLPIDFFFEALAADRRNQAIGVVLSGTGSDGSEGLRAIKAADGVTFAQEPRSAKFSGMPEAAMQAGVVDFSLPIPELAAKLLLIGRHPYVRRREAERLTTAAEESELKKVFILLRGAAGVDFSEYKLASIRRRLSRRMALLRLTDLSEYVRLLREDRAEAQALFDDILIHVTSLFRDADAFEALKVLVFPELLKQKRDGGTIRIWSAGCATGDEAYSLVIALLEFLAEQNASDVQVQLFGTDISEKAIEKARIGFYPESAVRAVGSERLARFFNKVDGGGFRINKAVRERCAFVKHDMASDPPFSKLDLVSCRNVLIYFGAELQKRVLATFQFALNQPGYLLLGHAENVADCSGLFSVVDRENKIFARTAARSSLRPTPARSDALPVAAPLAESRVRAATPGDLVRRTESLLLDQYAPPGVIVNERMEILHFRGRTAPYLEPTPGQPQHDVLKMARKGLVAELRIGLSQAKRQGTAVRRANVRFDEDGRTRVCDLVVVPVASPPEAREHVFAVLFEEKPSPDTSADAAPPSSSGRTVDEQHIAEELAATKGYLQSLIEEHQRTNDELMNANEELISSNEELQSLNEEVETAKEELQSTNEELNTLNEELRTRNSELNSVNCDLVNILGSVEVPIVIVDQARRIRRFTPKARPILNLLPSDVGRPIDDIKPTVAIDDLDRKIAMVIDTVAMHEEEVQARDGKWYRLQIRPYATVDKHIDGAVLSIVDVDVLKRALGAAEWARDYAIATVEAVQTPLVVLDETFSVLSANESFRERYGIHAVELAHRSLWEIAGSAWDVPVLRTALVGVLERDERFHGLALEREVPRLGPRAMALSGRRVSTPSGGRMVLLAVEDITERLAHETERARLLEDTRTARASAEEANRSKDLFLATLSHELRTPLSSLLLQAQLLRRGNIDEARLKSAALAIERATRAQATLIDDLFDVSRIVAGKLKIEMQPVNLGAIVRAAVETVQATIEKRRIALEVQIDDSLPAVSGDSARLQQVVLNLLTNALKFTPEQGRVQLMVDSVGSNGRIRVVDEGIGIDPEFVPHLFDRFSQEDQGSTRPHGGLGLGLSIVRSLVEAHGGTVHAESGGKGKGATFTVLLPLLSEQIAPSAPSERLSSPTTGSVAENIRDARILVVEDDAATRDALTEMLGSIGAIVRAADSAEAAVEVFAAFHPDVLVCDIAMPHENGFSLLRRVRALGPDRGGDVPAVALTALATEDDRRQALAEGFQVHLAKPVGVDRLVAAVSQLVRRAGAVNSRVASPSNPPRS